MPNNTINTGVATNGEFTVSYQRNGYGGVIPVINGTPEPRLMFGYASESDRIACMKLIEDAVRATGGDIMAAQYYIMNAVEVAANEITPDEAVDVDGTEILISYADKAAYLGTEKIADLDDLDCELPNEAVKALLKDRAKLSLSERNAYYDEVDDEFYWD